MKELFKLNYDEECIVLKRLSKFIVKVLVNDREEYAYLHNTGKLEDLVKEGRKCYCISTGKSRTSRRAKYDLFAIEYGDKAAIIDTRIQEKSYEVAVSDNILPWLRDCIVPKKNVRVNNSILDYKLKCKDLGEIYVELKSAVLVNNEMFALYPDTPTLRGRRHIRTLIQLREQGIYTLLVFIAGLPGVKGFMPNKSIDPKIHDLVKEAISKGVIVKAISIYYDPLETTVILDKPDLPIRLNG